MYAVGLFRCCAVAPLLFPLLRSLLACAYRPLSSPPPFAYNCSKFPLFYFWPLDWKSIYTTLEKREKASLGLLSFSNIFDISPFPFFFRQIVARTVLETLRSVVDDPSDVDAVLNVMNKLADDVGE